MKPPNCLFLDDEMHANKKGMREPNFMMPVYGSWVTVTNIPKVVVHNLVTFLIRTPMFEWYVVWYGSKIGYKVDMCFREKSDFLLRK